MSSNRNNVVRVKGAFRIIPFLNPSGETVYRVNGWIEGKRIRENYSSEAEALTAKQKHELAILNIAPAPMISTRLTQTQAAEAEWAFAELAGKPMTLAIRFFLDNYSDPAKVATVQEAFSRFMEAQGRENNRPETIRNLKTRIGFLNRRFSGKQMSEIQPEHVREIIFRPSITPVTMNNIRRALNQFFIWATKEGYCPKNPMATITPVKTDRDEPEILPLDRVRLLLSRAGEYKQGVCLPYVALGLFCAIRPTELARLSWEDVDLKAKTITIGAKLAKMRQRRIVEMSKNVVDWLLPYSIKKVPFVGKNWRRDFDFIKAQCGYGTADDEKPDLKPWTVDIMRHTGISNHLAFHQHEGKTAVWAGNSPDVIQKHYKGLVSEKEAKNFWAVSPTAKKVISFSVLREQSKAA